jgi:hypothetical protein
LLADERVLDVVIVSGALPSGARSELHGADFAFLGTGAGKQIWARIKARGGTRA